MPGPIGQVRTGPRVVADLRLTQRTLPNSTGICGWGLQPVGLTRKRTPVRNGAAGLTLAPEPWAIWDVTFLTRSTGR